MGFQLLPGDICVVQKQVIFDGKVALERGAVVTVKDIDPDPERPGLKYVVYSESLGREIRVVGASLERRDCPQCGAGLIGSAIKCGSCGWVLPGQENRSREKETAKYEEDLKRRLYGRDNW